MIDAAALLALDSVLAINAGPLLALDSVLTIDAAALLALDRVLSIDMVTDATAFLPLGDVLASDAAAFLPLDDVLPTFRRFMREHFRHLTTFPPARVENAGLDHKCVTCQFRMVEVCVLLFCQ